MREIFNSKEFMLLIALSSGLSQTAIAGVGSSGGGSAIVCRDANQIILRAQMYDLYEGRSYFGYSIPASAATPEAQLITVLQKLAVKGYAVPYVIQTANQIIKRIEFLPEDTVIAMPSDMGNDYPITHPTACQVEGVGFFTSAGVLEVSRTVYNAFSPSDKAAFILHESLYQLARAFGDAPAGANSEVARHLNASLFAQSNSNAEAISLLDEVLYPYSFLHNYFSVPGTGLQNFTIEVSSADPRAKDFQVQNLICMKSPQGEQSAYNVAQRSVDGFARLSISDLNCFEFGGDVKFIQYVTQVPNEAPIQFTLKIFSGSTLISTTAFGIGNGDSGGWALTTILPDTSLGRLP